MPGAEPEREHEQRDDDQRGDDPPEAGPPLALGVEPGLPEDEHGDERDEREPVALGVPEHAPEDRRVPVVDLAQRERAVEAEADGDEIERRPATRRCPAGRRDGGAGSRRGRYGRLRRMSPGAARWLLRSAAKLPALPRRLILAPTAVYSGRGEADLSLGPGRRTRSSGARRGAPSTARAAASAAPPPAVEQVGVVEVDVDVRREPSEGRARRHAERVRRRQLEQAAPPHAQPGRLGQREPGRARREVDGPEGGAVQSAYPSSATAAATPSSMYQPPPQKSRGARPRSRSHAASRRTRSAGSPPPTGRACPGPPQCVWWPSGPCAAAIRARASQSASLSPAARRAAASARRSRSRPGGAPGAARTRPAPVVERPLDVARDDRVALRTREMQSHRPAPSDELREVYERRAELEYPAPAPLPDPAPRPQVRAGLRARRRAAARADATSTPVAATGATSPRSPGCPRGRSTSRPPTSRSESSRSRAPRPRRAGIEVEAVRANLEALPFPDPSFDVVLCTQVIEHLLDPERGLAEIARVLAPGGRAIVTTDHSGTSSRRCSTCRAPSASAVSPAQARACSSTFRTGTSTASQIAAPRARRRSRDRARRDVPVLAERPLDWKPAVRVAERARPATRPPTASATSSSVVARHDQTV